ncbi:SDR family oxidoreductase [Tenacibaculum agarivorans]|uniref:SDR family oxidoreductase n=1 Tax=Tenacibaculum agarivorans TaxID=1908389 RepID=UPI00094B89D0|nr:NmrA family NAD(P)-binding protein [Tenacibaculum agarivorans]
MKIFVSGATGAQGGNIAKAMISKGHNVTTISRSEKMLNKIEIFKGDLNDVESIEAALKGTDAAVFTLPLVFDEKEAKNYVANFIKAAEKQNIDLVVYNTNFDLPESNNGFDSLDLKRELKEQFDNAELNVITLMPDVYLDNLAAPWSIPVILNNNIVPYPVASGSKTPWISHADLGKYTASAIEKPELAGQTLPIGGNVVTGEEIADAISNQIGKTVNFVGVSPDDFEQQLTPAFGEIPAREISNLYRYVADKNEYLISKDFAKTNEILNVQPQTLDDWAASVKWELS